MPVSYKSQEHPDTGIIIYGMKTGIAHRFHRLAMGAAIISVRKLICVWSTGMMHDIYTFGMKKTAPAGM